MQGISVVVPVFNEEGNVRELHKEILEVCKKENYKFEIIFVDDGSKDKTPEICKELKPLKYIRMRKNFGQTAAMDAGIKLAQYDYIVTMDGDRQNDPADIPKLVNYLEENDLDIVSGWRKNRKDTVMKNTICSATKERQLSAKNLAKEVDCMIVIGGKHSSNTQKLVNICKDLTNTFAIETKDELNKEELKNYKSIGITAGASTPDWIISEVIEFLESI